MSLVVVVSLLALWLWRSKRVAAPTTIKETSNAGVISGNTPEVSGASDSTPTNVYAHNLMLRKGPTGFRVYVRWLRGRMARTSRNVNPSFDDPDSFFIDVKNGVVHTNVGDLANFLNEGVSNSPLTNIKLSGDGDQLKLNGTLHKVIPLPIEVISTIGVAPDNRIQIHVTKINLLKIPFKKVLGGMDVTVSSLFHPGDIPGVEVKENDIFLDTGKAVPPPHIRGQLTSVRIVNPDFQQIYGNAQEDVTRVEQWRNFLQLHGGTIDFGKLTMRQVDLMMVDLSNNAWFDLDLANYQDQLVNGYTRMTPEAGLQIFMPSLDQIPADKKNHSISMEWLKHRNLPPPPYVTSR
ncbi:MAG TPA: hypothetical protein VH140_05415 [Candidatus Acidoferrum sp.]|nr:hypothetical protein [Candidatus Acidoferrum sp.]